MSIIFYCHRCGQKGEFKTKKDMRCDCGHYVKDHYDTRNYVNMGKTWSKTTKVEFNHTTMDKDIAERNSR